MSLDLTTGGKFNSRARWVLLGLLWIAFLINNVDRQVVFSIFPILAQQMHFSRVQLGLVGSIFLWFYCGSNPLMGRLADVIQRERLVIVSIILWSVAALGTALSYSVHVFLYWRAALGLADSLYVPAALSLIAAWHPERTRSSALSIHSTAQFAGLALGGWAGGVAAETLGWRQGFSMLAGVGILYTVILVIMIPRKPNPTVEKKKVQASPFDVFRSRCFVALFVSYTLFAAMLFIFYNWLPDFVFNKYHMSLAASGVAGTGYLQAGQVVGALIWGFVADYISSRVRAGRYYLITLDMMGCVPLAIIILNVNSLAVMKVACVGFGLFAGGLSANIVAAAFDVIAAKNFGFTTGLINLATGIGGGGGVLLVGWINNPNAAPMVMKWIAMGVVAGAMGLSVVAVKRYALERNYALSEAGR